MKRETAIKKLLGIVHKDALAKTVALELQHQPKNYTLLLLNHAFQSCEDKHDNWFTALSVVCIHQGLFALSLVQKAAKLGGTPPLTSAIKRDILNVIAQGGKLTKADAG